MENILKVDKIEKYYGSRSSLTKAIDNLSFEVEKGEFVAIMGASGSGKTTLLNVISTIDKVTSGHIYVGGEDITKLKGNQLNKFRREELGFIFQDFNLLDTLTAYENIALALSIQNVSASGAPRDAPGRRRPRQPGPRAPGPPLHPPHPDRLACRHRPRAGRGPAVRDPGDAGAAQPPAR